MNWMAARMRRPTRRNIRWRHRPLLWPTRPKPDILLMDGIPNPHSKRASPKLPVVQSALNICMPSGYPTVSHAPPGNIYPPTAQRVQHVLLATIVRVAH